MHQKSKSKPPKVLVVIGHPRRQSFCGALADAYVAGATSIGAEVQRLSLADATFEPNVLVPSPRDQTLEPDVSEAVRLVGWAEHLVFVFPTWWGTMPACLKGFLDRVLMPGFAFADRDDDEGWDKLLTGKTAHLLTTMDTPPWVYRWIYRAPGLNALSRATLGFCGIAPVRSTVFGPVKPSTTERRAEWIEQARNAGLALRDGALTPGQRIRGNLAAWLASLRLQFHPMAWAAYVIGAVGAAQTTGHFSPTAFWVGLACLFALELATVFTNDIFDYESDVRNRHFGPFTGGSRVLVDGSISFGSMQIATALALGLYVVLGMALTIVVPPFPILLILAALGVLAIGYTMPPLKLCWRGWGELDVAITHSFGVVLCGYVCQGGALTNSWPWLVAVPLFFAILPAITLSGIPDHDADRAAGKGTIAVRYGPQVAVRLAQAATAAAAVSAVALLPTLFGRQVLGASALLIAPYAIVQLVVLQRYLGRHADPRRIDGLMAMSLTFILLFVAIPLCALLQ